MSVSQKFIFSRSLKNIRAVCLVIILVLIYFTPGKAQVGDTLTETFYQQLYSYNFGRAESTLTQIQLKYKQDIIYEMVSINYGYWMLFTGRNNAKQNSELLERIESYIEIIEDSKSGKSFTQEKLLQLILLYSFQSRIHNKLDNTLSAVQSFRTSYTYFKKLEPCTQGSCEIYNLVAGMYYVLTGYIRKDYPLVFRLAFDGEFADVNEGLSLLSRGINSPTLQIDIESRYFLMKLYAEVIEDYEYALVYANQLVDLYPNNLTYRIYQMFLYHKLHRHEDVKNAYAKFLKIIDQNPDLTPNQKKVLLNECNESIL